ncbi:HigA family addiction module antitoxin [Rhodoferax sp.]|uniref:HigA family addiction module antitoxin n=1 Tax=Rhodoferax sp. TaxID=50421 RepID=UPI00260E19D2|nr:HigA family addiction module antitoxin [Rhodoferax sp.]MDD2809283.1 HigA family addiction module antitoxin [Rhodoferax sp.]
MNSLRNPNRKPTHPGAVLREDVLPAMGITQARMAELLGVSRVTLAQLLHEHRALSGDMAMRLEKLLGTSAESWLTMQQAVDLWEARQDVQRIANVVHYSLNDLLAMQGNKPLLIDKGWDTMPPSGQEAPL